MAYYIEIDLRFRCWCYRRKEPTERAWPQLIFGERSSLRIIAIVYRNGGRCGFEQIVSLSVVLFVAGNDRYEA